MNDNESCCLISHIHNLYLSKKFDELFFLIKNNTFDVKYHNFLEKLWYDSHYTIYATTRNIELGPVQRYRVRKKNPPPCTISDGDQTIYHVKERSRRILINFYQENAYILNLS
ncbi:hypothetical protein A3Q56_06327 [Intoshia linei]|uniref:Homeobox protein SIX1 N-terminal SD domain-containing protein n=1 Tax=Intoshia linei TaxID=1819745 RepID=A0A177AWS7_9BILA|nr:hypothetical protein A3Q56_06327 [Intoshia linei]